MMNAFEAEITSGRLTPEEEAAFLTYYEKMTLRQFVKAFDFTFGKRISPSTARRWYAEIRHKKVKEGTTKREVRPNQAHLMYAEGCEVP